MRKQRHKSRNRQRLNNHRQQVQRQHPDHGDTQDNEKVFDDTSELIFAIGQVLKDPEINTVFLHSRDGEFVCLAGPNEKNKVITQVACARTSQIEAVKDKYKEHVLTNIQAEGRMEHAEGNGVDTLQKMKLEDKYTREQWRKIQATHGKSESNADYEYDFYATKEHWFNDEYWVVLDKECDAALTTTFLDHSLWHLRITRNDEGRVHDWRVLQAIKNKVVGEEYEAIELYPAHSRLMDIGNCYHLWVLAPNADEQEPPRYPIGCKNPKKGGAVSLQRMIMTETAVSSFSPEEFEKMCETFESVDRPIFVLPEALVEEAKAWAGVSDPTPTDSDGIMVAALDDHNTLLLADVAGRDRITNAIAAYLKSHPDIIGTLKGLRGEGANNTTVAKMLAHQDQQDNADHLGDDLDGFIRTHKHSKDNMLIIIKASKANHPQAHELRKSGIRLCLFPDEHLDEARRMFPGKEGVMVMTEYSKLHPEILLVDEASGEQVAA